MLHAAWVAMPALVAGGCSGPLSTLDAAGPAARDVAMLWWVMLAGATVLTLLVVVLLALAFLRRQGEGQTGAALWIGWLGLALPGAVLLALLGSALVLGERMIARSDPGAVLVEATGHQWFWEFRQPGLEGPIATRDVLHIPAGRPVHVRIAAADVIHSFWVPRLAGKMDAIPGHVNLLRIQAARPGEFEGQCAEFCGLEHASHRFRVVAHDEAGWAAFQRGEMP